MFAELTTEAGPIQNIGRAEAKLTNTPHVYQFVWPDVKKYIPPDVILYACLYITREGGPCVGMSEIDKGSGSKVRVGDHIYLDWRIYFPPPPDYPPVPKPHDYTAA